MSHEATNWAIKQRGLKPAAKLVLWHLCDRFHPDNGCFPSQETLARDCEMSRSSLNEHLASLEAAALIRREVRRDIATKQQKSTMYRFAFEPDFPCPESGHGEKTVSGNEQEPCPENAESRVRNPDTNLVREPVREPEERERASDSAEERKAMERAFERAWQKWPTSIGDSRPQALNAWMTLSPEERNAAIDETERYVAGVKATGRKMLCSHAVFLREKRWENLPPRTETEKGSFIDAAPFGALWAVARFKQLLSGPKVPFSGFTLLEKSMLANGANEDAMRRDKQAKTGWPQINRMNELASARQGVAVSSKLEALKPHVEPVPVGAERWIEWKTFHERKGWPWMPDPGNQPVVYFPVGGPDGLNEFENAVLGNDHDGSR